MDSAFKKYKNYYLGGIASCIIYGAVLGANRKSGSAIHGAYLGGIAGFVLGLAWPISLPLTGFYYIKHCPHHKK